MAETMDKTTGKKTAVKKVGAAKKPVAAKAAEKKAPEMEADPVAATENTSATAMNVTAEQRYRMVAEAAYYRAESNQFMSDPVRDWIEAEGDIAALLNDNK